MPKLATKPKPATQADKSAEKPEATETTQAEKHAVARAVAERLFRLYAESTVSIPVKLRATYRAYKRDVQPHPNGRKPSERQAGALTLACLASGKKIRNGTKFPRNFELGGAPYCIENGCLSDALKSGLCTYSADSEAITIRNAAEISGLIGSKSALPDVAAIRAEIAAQTDS